MYFVEQARNNHNELQWYDVIMVEWGPESNKVINRVGAYAEYVSEDYLFL